MHKALQPRATHLFIILALSVIGTECASGMQNKIKAFSEKGSFDFTSKVKLPYAFYSSIDEKTNRREYKLFVYEPENNILIGCLYFHAGKRPVCYDICLQTIAIIKNWRSRGLGSYLLNWATKVFRQLALDNNIGTIVSLIAEPLITAGDTKKDLIPKNKLLEFYKKAGFTPNNERSNLMTMCINKNGELIK